jgi:hypothetical protein
LWLFLSSVVVAADPGLQLAMELLKEGDHHGSAIEFRRLALGAEDPRNRGSYYWAAAYQYLEAGEPEMSVKMLDLAEDEAPELSPFAFLLRGDASVAAESPGEAMFYFESILRHADSADEARNLAARRLAGVHLREGKVSEARRLLISAPGDHHIGLEALEAYDAGKDKNPKWGGLLGLVPGLGYAYAGEYANGLRSLILNGLFIWGMVETADDEQWAAFSLITFFEITWYSGSIYGGVDASHRHNRRRLERSIEAIDGDAGYEPQYEHLPTVALKFEF